MKHRIDARRLASELASLPNLDREELIGRWRKLYGTEPPVRISNNFLIRAIAHRMQEQVFGGLKPATKRFLTKAAERRRIGKTIAPLPAIKSGTRLLREWHGVTHEVIVEEKGVLFQGKQYRSLSEVARVITGARWSGPLFFGLKKGAA